MLILAHVDAHVSRDDARQLRQYLVLVASEVKVTERITEGWPSGYASRPSPNCVAAVALARIGEARAIAMSSAPGSPSEFRS